MKKLAFFFFAFVILGCQEASNESVVNPSLIIQRDSFVQVLTEIQLLETARKQKMVKGKDPLKALTQQYKLIYDKFDVTQEQFEITHSYYYKQPEEMVKLYDDVIAEITRREAALTPGEDQ